jgi:hypothetical protein
VTPNRAKQAIRVTNRLVVFIVMAFWQSQRGIVTNKIGRHDRYHENILRNAKSFPSFMAADLFHA